MSIKENLKKIGKTVREAFDGRTVTSVSKKSGITRLTIHSLLKGSNIQLQTLVKLAHGLGKELVISFQDGKAA